jgi:hypothetical protein
VVDYAFERHLSGGIHVPTNRQAKRIQAEHERQLKLARGATSRDAIERANEQRDSSPEPQ